MDQNFKISADNERPDSYLRPRRESLRLDKVNRRLTLASFLLFFLTAAIAFAGYMYIQKKIEAVSKESEVKGLSKDLEAKFSDLAQRIVKLEESFKKEVAPLGELSVNFEETAAALTAFRENLKRLESVIAEVKSSKADKKELERFEKMEKTFADFSSSFEPVRAEVKSVDSRVKAIEDKLSSQIAKMVESVEKAANEINRVQADITKQSFNKIDQKTLDIALRRQQEKFQKDMSDITGRLQDREDQIKSLERRIKDLEAGHRSSGGYTPLPRPSSGKPSGGGKPDPITEQNLD